LSTLSKELETLEHSYEEKVESLLEIEEKAEVIEAQRN